jgi:hypothetical protein
MLRIHFVPLTATDCDEAAIICSIVASTPIRNGFGGNRKNAQESIGASSHARVAATIAFLDARILYPRRTRWEHHAIAASLLREMEPDLTDRPRAVCDPSS